MGQACLLSVSLKNNLSGLFVGKVLISVSCLFFLLGWSGTPGRSLVLAKWVKVLLLVFWEPEFNEGKGWGVSAFIMETIYSISSNRTQTIPRSRQTDFLSAKNKGLVFCRGKGAVTQWGSRSKQVIASQISPTQSCLSYRLPPPVFSSCYACWCPRLNLLRILLCKQNGSLQVAQSQQQFLKSVHSYYSSIHFPVIRILPSYSSPYPHEIVFSF